MLSAVKPVVPAKPVKPVAAVAQVKPVRGVKPPAQPSPMARAPVAKTSRVVPGVASGRGVVRTDTHNAANNHAPAKSKHGKRGFRGGRE